MKNKNKIAKIAIIGSYPPPYGGISVHIQRILIYLDKEDFNYDFYIENRIKNNTLSYYKFYGIKKLKSLARLFFIRYTLIHHHSPDWKIRIILSIYGMFGKNIYLHIHGESLKDTIKSGGIKSFLTRKTLKFVNIIADNENIAQLVKKYHPKSVMLMDAFLPPLYKDYIYQDFITKYRKVLQNRKCIISMLGWISYYKDIDLYGFDIALQALKRFKEEVVKEVLLLVSINGIRTEKLHIKIENYIKENNLERNVFFIYNELPEIWPIYIVSNMFIRPTFTDGSALSVKEATWFETPVIASDCVPRPKGVIIFKDRSSDELFEKIVQVCNSYNKPKKIEDRINKTLRKRFKYKLYDKVLNLNFRRK